jgi:hypothetical protein
MGKLVKQRHLNLYKKYTEQLIEDLSTPVSLLYDDATTQCNNCIYDIMHKCSSGKYNGTGPKPFDRGYCPVCKGKGTLSTEISYTINCTVNWVNLTESDESAILPPGKKVKGYFKIKTLVANYDLINGAKYLIVDGVKTTLLNIIKRGLKENVACIAYCARDD